MAADREWGRRHGGWRQRLAADRASPVLQISGSKLATTLLTEWAWGNLSVAALQRICQAATDDGVTHHVVQQLAALGTHGEHPQQLLQGS